MSFNKLLSNWDILDYLAEKKFDTPTEIQTRAIPLLLKGKSVSAVAQTGTGKTLAYSIPLISKIKDIEERGGINENKAAPYAIILAPTRELAGQVEQVIKSVAHHAKLRVRLLISGESAKKTERILSSSFEILVTVPGKLATSLKNGEIDPSNLRTLVMDEADQLLDMGFSKDVKSIWSSFNGFGVQVSLFSATLPDAFEEFKKSVFENVEFEEISIKGAHTVRTNIETYNIFLSYKEKQKMTVEFLKKHGGGQGIIFVNQKKDAEEVHKFLETEIKGRKVYLLHGEMSGKDRRISYRNFSRSNGILVSTDIAARGLDITGLLWVLNYDLPFDSIYYIHRVGRTGRQGKPGAAFNFVTSKDERLITKINEAIKEQDTLQIKPLEMLKKKKPVSKHVAQKIAKKIAKNEPKKKIDRTRRPKKSPGFARKKKVKR